MSNIKHIFNQLKQSEKYGAVINHDCEYIADLNVINLDTDICMDITYADNPFNEKTLSFSVSALEDYALDSDGNIILTDTEGEEYTITILQPNPFTHGIN